MESLSETRRSTIERLNRLPPHRLVQALDYIDYLLATSEKSVSPLPSAPRGSPDDLAACGGIWQFDPAELDGILRDVEQSRLMELGESYDCLPA